MGEVGVRGGRLERVLEWIVLHLAHIYNYFQLQLRCARQLCCYSTFLLNSSRTATKTIYNYLCFKRLKIIYQKRQKDPMRVSQGPRYNMYEPRAIGPATSPSDVPFVILAPQPRDILQDKWPCHPSRCSHCSLDLDPNLFVYNTVLV